MHPHAVTPIRFRLHNIRQHRDLVFHYRTGSIGVFGNNRSGKSNAFHKGQYFAITGKTEGDKNDNLRDGASAGFSEFVFMSDGVEYTRTNKLPGSSSALEWTDELGVRQQIKGMRAVDERMQELLGASYDIIREVCFARQEELYTPVISTKQELLAFFQRVSGCQKAESIRSAVQTCLSRLAVPVDNSEKIAEGVRLIAEGTERLDKARADYDTLSAQLPKDINARISELRAVGDATDSDELEASRRASMERLAELNERIRAQEKLLEDAPDAVQVPPGWSDAYALSVEKKQLESQLAQVIEAGRSAYAKFSALEAPEEENVQAVADLRDRLKEAELVVSMLDTGTCPTCRRPFTVEDPELASRVYEGLKSSYADADGQLTAVRIRNKNRDAQKAALLAQLRDKTADKNKLETKLEGLSAKLRSVPGFSEDAYQEILRNNQDVAGKSAELKAVAETLSTLNASRQSVEDALESMASQRCSTEAERQAAAEELDFITRTYQARTSLVESIARLEGWKESAEASLNAARREHAEGERLRYVRRVLEDVRALMHRDVLPRFVMSRLVGGMNSWMGFYLRRLGKEYRLRITPEFVLLKITKEGDEYPCADRLSGGELIASALAFRMSLGALMVGRLPVQLLDEPTTWLDEPTRTHLAEVLRDMKNVIGAGNYIIIPTHDPEIISALDHAFSMETKDYIADL